MVLSPYGFIPRLQLEARPRAVVLAEAQALGERVVLTGLDEKDRGEGNLIAERCEPLFSRPRNAGAGSLA
jgi:hypothetical protein